VRGGGRGGDREVEHGVGGKASRELGGNLEGVKVGGGGSGGLVTCDCPCLQM
jgi:hypothetical protein